MIYLCAMPVGLVAVLVYIVSKKWDLKIINFISKIIIIISVIFFVITYASFLGYNIPFISDFCNNLINYIK